jgi:hypothetical protein
MDGSLAALAEQHRDMPFEEFARNFLGEHEGLVHMNQISPKIFEAVRLRTALVLFEGDYSGVVRAHEHYIPLAKDYSNVDEVFAKLEDLPFLEEMTERAYRDVIATGTYSYRRFIEGVDAYLWRRAGGRRRATLVSAPLLAVYGPGNGHGLLQSGPGAILVSDALLGPALPREQIEAMTVAARLAGTAGALDFRLKPDDPLLPGSMGVARRIWKLLPEPTRFRLAGGLKAALSEGAPATPAARFIKRFWRLLPGSLRARIAARIG